MKSIAAALAAMLWGGFALAGEPATTRQQTQMEEQQYLEEGTVTVPTDNSEAAIPVPEPQAQDVPTVGPAPDESQAVTPVPDSGDVVVAEDDVIMTEEEERPNRPDLIKDMHVMVGMGGEGYTGVLSDRLDPGFSWSVTVGAQPLNWMGVELGYSGAVNDLNDNIAPGQGAANGADFVRNGGQIAATFNIPTPIVQPYALAGVGFDRYTYRGINDATFRDDTAGRVPLGGGLKARRGNFVADLRFHYDALFDQQFARTGPDDDIGGAVTGTLSVGARF
jgi:hypothetical protein